MTRARRSTEASRASGPITDALIAAEPGAVIRAGSTIVKAFFFSTGGGATENNEYVFVSSKGTPGTSKVSYLRGITDRSPDGVPYDLDAPYYDWTTSSLSRTTLSAMFAKDPRTNVGSLTKLDLRRRGVSGRLYQVVLYGSKGTKTVSANTFRSVYNATKPSTAKTAALEPVRHEAHPAAVARTELPAGDHPRGLLRARGAGTARCRPAAPARPRRRPTP